MTHHKLEIACYRVEDALLAEQAGADRIELCAGRSEGGLTPSYGELLQAKDIITLPVHPIIRPRGGDFNYSQRELESMKDDLALIKELGFPGVVLGVLDKDGHPNIAVLETLLKIVGTMNITFHRAFDMCCDPFTALEQLTDLGISHILTSGQQRSAIKGITLIEQLVLNSRGPIILAGGGVRAIDIPELAKVGVTQFHASASKIVSSQMRFRCSTVAISTENDSEFSQFCVDPKSVKTMKIALQELSFNKL